MVRSEPGLVLAGLLDSSPWWATRESCAELVKDWFIPSRQGEVLTCVQQSWGYNSVLCSCTMLVLRDLLMLPLISEILVFFFFFNFSSSVCLLNRHLCPRLLTVSNPRFAVLFQSFSPLIPTLFRREQVEVAAGEADQTSENSQSFPKSLFSLWFPFQWLWSPLCSLHDKWDQQNLTKLGNKGGVSQGVWETTTYFIVLLLRQLG